jgi:hypothetical protein
MTSDRLLPILLGICGLLQSPLPAALAQDLRCGMAKTDITPTKPVSLAGYEARKELSQGVHDPLSARAVAFDCKGQKLVLVSVDNLGFYNGTADLLRKEILDSCRLQPSEVFLCAIHTHSAPTLTLNPAGGHTNNVEYTRALRGQLVELVRTALGRLTAIQVGVGSGSSPVGVNRREVVRDSAGKPKIVLGRNPSVAIDREVQVLKLARADRHELAAVLFAYPTHSTSLGTKNYLVSGDIHGLAEQFLEKHLGGDVVAPAFAGASGDIDPWYRVLPAFKTTNGWVPEPVLMGTLLGEEVAHALEGIKNFTTNGPVKTRFKTVELPGKPRGEAQAQAGSPPVPFNLTVGRVGDIAFVGLGGEVFNDIGRAIKSASAFPHTFILTHCNGAAGYVPTQPSYAEGGYEVQSSPFAPGAAELLVEETGRLLWELQTSPD